MSAPLTVTREAARALEALANQSSAERPGFSLYWCDGVAECPDPMPEPAVWETVQSSGWKLDTVDVSHLPAESLVEIDELIFFMGTQAAALELDFRDGQFRLDDATCEHQSLPRA